MLIKVKLFGSLGNYFPEAKSGTSFQIECPENSRLENVIRKLNIPLEETKLIFVNGLSRAPGCELKEDDEVSIFPRLAEDNLPNIQIDVNLYGELAAIPSVPQHLGLHTSALR